ncbi:uncharacterized protein LOC122392348 [Amphibalanus amphitrite]|uniref:uncharacterized protein LOC122392348 n=1 Tax=Amphibalanus amphitrite TaxID=1232801 RepID=UPI001C91D66E|nr:uncharacterized protein LOC122392348 [Amphibalanus amphitrite]
MLPSGTPEMTGVQSECFPSSTTRWDRWLSTLVNNSCAEAVSAAGIVRAELTQELRHSTTGYGERGQAWGVENRGGWRSLTFFLVAALLAVAAADSAPSYAPRPAYHPQPAYKPAPYNYDVHGYGDYEPVFNAQEARDGYATQGSYSVVLPDGRTQTVTYRVDDAYSGTVAEVTYEGEARYDEYKPSYKPSYPQPSYKPTYKPAYGN